MHDKKILIIYISISIILTNLILLKVSKNQEHQSDEIGEVLIATYIDGKFSSNLPSKKDAYIYNVEKITCDNDLQASWDYDNWGISFSDNINSMKCNIYFKFKTTYEFDFTGSLQTFIVPKTGLYKLEIWGAQGGSTGTYTGGYGGYSSGIISLQNGDTLNINVGGTALSKNGGYNGGGTGGIGYDSYATGLGGGGATSITNLLIEDGQLTNYENNLDNILIVAGGGGGVSSSCATLGGAGGGMNGTKNEKKGNSNYGTQTNGYAFGKGQNGISKNSAADCGAEGNGGGGGGLYGGYSYQGTGTNSNASGGGGSGYIDNKLLISKSMSCYNCEESKEVSTYTKSTTCSEETATENCAKKGNGYAKITYLVNVNIEYYADNIKIDKAPNSSTYNFNKIDCQNGSNLTWDSDKWEFAINDYKENDTCKIYFSSKTTIELAYTGDAQEFIVPKTGVYKLEVWGAEGGSNNENDGGYGGYASGLISLARGDNLNIAIGGTTTSKTGGYNGGGAGGSGGGSYASGLGGGGATSITSSLINDGQLANYENNKDAVLIVAGGGGGVNEACATLGGSGGGMNGAKNAVRTDGYSGGNSNYGTQTTGYAFGQGQPGKSKDGYANCGAEGNGGGGGGYYGGFSYQGTGQYSNESGGGGSGYIGNSLLNNKIMYCYNCTESSEESTKTITTTCNEETPTENCAKKGNGYARITFIEATN